MPKLKQRNWLIIITVFLVIASSVGFFISVQDKIKFKTCGYGESIYKSGDAIPGYNGRSDCFCSQNGNITCSESTNSENILTSFSTSNLFFTSFYLNLIDASEPSPFYVKPVNASFVDGKISVSLEREMYCNSEGDAASQIGLYQISESQLRITTSTSRDVVKYNKTCRIENKFEVGNITFALKEDFKIYYLAENGQTFNLGVCVDGGRLYSNEEVFQRSNSSEICSCDDGTVKCDVLD